MLSYASITGVKFNTLVVAVTFLAIFAMAARFSLDTDTWWHLRTGELIAEQGSIPHTDSFSYTREGHDWSYPGTAWLSELQLFHIYTAFSPGALNLWTAALVTLAFVLIYPAMSGPPLLRAFVLVFAVTVSGIYWAARPYMVSLVIAAAFIAILEDYRWGRRNRLVWLPIFMVLWVNSHAGFGIGFLLLGVYLGARLLAWLNAKWRGTRKQAAAAFELLRPLFFVTAALLVAASLNPSGPAVFAYPFETVAIGELRDHIQEWQSPNFHDLQAQPFAWMLLTLLGVLAISSRRLVLTDFLLIAGFAFMGLLAARNIPLFSLAGAVVLSRYAAPLLETKSNKRKPAPAPAWQAWVNILLVALIALAAVARAASTLPENANREALAENIPLGAIDYIRDHQPPGPLFNSYNWGGYLLWELRDYPVYIDGRTDLYADGLLSEWLDTVSANDGWQQTLDRWGVRLVLVEPSWALAKLLPSEGWQLLYEDDLSVLYGR